MKFSAKILLFGEYLVLHKSDALLIPLAKYSGELAFIDNSEELKNGRFYSNTTIRNFYEYLYRECNLADLKKWFKLSQFKRDIGEGLYFKSNIPVGYGVGSSGALTAAVFNKYSKFSLMEWKNNLQQLQNRLAMLEMYFHGKSSGLDPLLSYLHRGIHLQNGSLKVNDISTATVNPFLIDTRKSRTTGELVNIYRKKSLNTDYFEVIKTKLKNTNNQCINFLEKREVTSFFNTLKKLSALQLEYFREMILPEYEPIWKKGIESGDFYLKLCGAGGGGYLLGFTLNKEVLKGLKEEFQLEIMDV